MIDAIALASISVALLGSPFLSLEAFSSSSNRNFVFLLAAALFILRTLLAVFISYLMMWRIAEEQVRVGQENYLFIDSLPWLERREFSQGDSAIAIDHAPNDLFLRFLIPGVETAAEVLSVLALVLVLAYSQPITALVSLLYFGGAVGIQHSVLSKRILSAGKTAADSLREVTNLIADIQALSKLTRIYKSNSLRPFLQDKRTIRALSVRRVSFLENLPRNLMEVTIILGVVVVASSTFLLSGQDKVSGALTLFAVASFRLLPSFNRMQAGVLMIFSSSTMAEKALIAWHENDKTLNISAPQHGEELSPIDPPGGAANEFVVVEVKNVSFKYPDSSSFVLMDISLNFLVGKQYAIVGESGSGKTTLADLILGLLPPTSGRISLRKGTHQAQLGYVPQTTYTFEGSLARNIALEWDDGLIDSTKLDRSIAGAALDRLIGDQDPRKFPANMLSGGQSQRVGIARALYREPLLIVLDEATNSLDSETEDEVLHALGALRGKVTIVMIAHSMRTIQNADEVIMVDKGHVIGTGSFSELRKKCEKFDALVESGKLFEI